MTNYIIAKDNTLFASCLFIFVFYRAAKRAQISKKPKDVEEQHKKGEKVLVVTKEYLQRM